MGIFRRKNKAETNGNVVAPDYSEAETEDLRCIIENKWEYTAEAIEAAATELKKRGVGVECEPTKKLEANNTDALEPRTRQPGKTNIASENQTPTEKQPALGDANSFTMRQNYSRDDYASESQEERRNTWWEFCGYLEMNFSGKSFGYDSFPDLNWEKMTFSTIFAALKEAGYIKSDGYAKFRLTGMKREQVFKW